MSCLGKFQIWRIKTVAGYPASHKKFHKPQKSARPSLFYKPVKHGVPISDCFNKCGIFIPDSQLGCQFVGKINICFCKT